jgi:hypothetical protein
MVGGEQSEDVTAFTRGVVVPQASRFALERDLEAVARAAQHIADQVLLAPLLASRQQRHQHRFQSGQQISPDGIALLVEITAWAVAVTAWLAATAAWAVAAELELVALAALETAVAALVAALEAWALAVLTCVAAMLALMPALVALVATPVA